MKKWQKKALVSLVLLVPLVLGACSSNNEEANEATQGSSGGETMTENVSFTNEWDKVFPESDTVNHRKVTFQNRYGITLVADLYESINDKISDSSCDGMSDGDRAYVYGTRSIRASR